MADQTTRSTRTLASGESLSVSHYGGQVLSWRDAGGQELLYLSPLAVADGKTAIRGGVPVCFPQFAGRGPLVKHGFARTSVWRETAMDDPATVHMVLADDDRSRAHWPFRFRLELLARIAPRSLTITLSVHNTDVQPWSFTGALHTYLRTQSVASAQLSGLGGAQYEDALAGNVLRRDPGTGPDLSQPLDRVYREVPGALLLREGIRALRIEQQGFADVVVWNPGPAGAAKLADMPPGDDAHMLCVEAAQVASEVVLQPGAAWVGVQRLTQVDQGHLSH